MINLPSQFPNNEVNEGDQFILAFLAVQKELDWENTKNTKNTYLHVSLRGLEEILIPASRDNGNVVWVVLRDDSPGEENWHPQLVVKPGER